MEKKDVKEFLVALAFIICIVFSILFLNLYVFYGSSSSGGNILILSSVILFILPLFVSYINNEIKDTKKINELNIPINVSELDPIEKKILGEDMSGL